MNDRLRQARDEAERYMHRVIPYDTMADHYSAIAAFTDGAMWADANPQPHTTQEHDRAEAESDRLMLKLLREEIDRLKRILQAPLSLTVMQAAWEQAEVPTDSNPIREGDTVIFRDQQGDFAVFKQAGFILKRHIDGARVLSRAPQREPWADLADVIEGIEDSDWTDRPDLLAKMLHERGVRVAVDKK